MNPHPDFVGSRLPRHVRLGAFELTPLAPPNAVEDFEVVSQSEPVLTGLFGDTWPAGLTLADNQIDMAWHEREFTALRSFSWIIRDPSGGYLGCAYLFPTLGERGVGEVVTWMRDLPDRGAHLTRFNAVFQPWLRTYLPDDYRVSITSNT